jgi:putative transposase
MIQPEHKLPIVKQCKIVALAPSTFYYKAEPVSEADLKVMFRIDQLHLEMPFAGARMLRDKLREEGLHIGRKHVTTLMRRMGLEALYRKPNLSKRHPEHKIYPYLLRGLSIERANHVWCTDISYIPMRHGFMYLFAVMDWATRRILAWRLSNTLTTDFCVEGLEEAIARYGIPEIFNTDQGSQFTDKDFTDVLKEHGIEISMDGRGRWRDNVFIERFWRSIKYEEIYLRAYADGREAKDGIGAYITLYNGSRPHSSLEGKTPDSAYFQQLPELRAA